MKKNVLVLINGVVHPSIMAKISLKVLLLTIDKKIDYTVRSNLKDLQLLNMGTFDAVILYYHLKDIDHDSLKALIDFVESGGGVLALHSSMASFKRNSAYKDFMGGRFREHGKIENFTVFPVATEHPILNDISPFTVRDELYIHDYDEENEILLTVNNMGAEEPALWIKNYGSGRICYFAPGHCFGVWLNKEVRKVIINALSWLFREEAE